MTEEPKVLKTKDKNLMIILCSYGVPILGVEAFGHKKLVSFDDTDGRATELKDKYIGKEELSVDIWCVFDAYTEVNRVLFN